MSERVLVSGAFGGTLRQTGPQRLEADLAHGPLTFLMFVPALFFGLGSVVFVAVSAAAGDVPPAGYVGAFLGLAMAVALGTLAFRRMKSMGRFVIDGAARRVSKRRGDREHEGAGFDEVARVGRRWDPFHRGFVPQHWLVIELKDGRRYRLAKGPKAEVEAVLRLLGQWGLPLTPG